MVSIPLRVRLKGYGFSVRGTDCWWGSIDDGDRFRSSETVPVLLSANGAGKVCLYAKKGGCGEAKPIIF